MKWILFFAVAYNSYFDRHVQAGKGVVKVVTADSIKIYIIPNYREHFIWIDGERFNIK